MYPPSRFPSVLQHCATAGALLAATVGAQAATLVEGFTVVTPLGWTAINNSANAASAADPGGWFQGVSSSTTFSAQAGVATSYAAASFDSTTGLNDISAWLITPTLSFNNGDVLSFYTRTVALSPFPDAMEVRFSAVGGTNVGSTTTSVGTFTTTLLSINPSLTQGGYPEAWTQYSVAINGLSGATNGAIAFRYVVSAGGPFGNNSNYIGVDSLTITPVPEPATYLLMALGVVGIAARRRVRAH